MMVVTMTTIVDWKVSLRVGQVTFWSSLVTSCANPNTCSLRHAASVTTPATRNAPVPSTNEFGLLVKYDHAHSPLLVSSHANVTPATANITWVHFLSIRLSPP